MKKYWIFAMVLIVILSVVSGQIGAQDGMTEALWREDIEFLRERMLAAHPNPFHTISEAEYNAAFDSLLTELPNLTEDQIAVRIMRLVNFLRDGHSGIPPHFGQRYAFHFYPLRFYLFEDGLFVVDAAPEYAEAIGARVVQVGTMDFETAFDTLSMAANYENEWSQLTSATFHFGWVESLIGGGVIESVEQPNFVLETTDGETLILNPVIVDVDEYIAYFGDNFWGLPWRDAPLYTSNPDAFWLTYLEDEEAIYMQYNATVRQNDEGDTIGEMGQQIETLLEENPVRRVIIDLRHNLGGDLNTSRPLLNLFANKNFFQEPGNLILLTSRNTFSAATWFALQLDETTVLMGEPTGGNAHMFENARVLTLPNSGLMMLIASRQRHDIEDDDPRQAVGVDVAVPLTSTDYFNGVDPVLDAALAY